MNLRTLIIVILAAVIGYWARTVQYPEYCPKCYTKQTTSAPR
jgi:hypothetical protein